MAEEASALLFLGGDGRHERGPSAWAARLESFRDEARDIALGVQGPCQDYAARIGLDLARSLMRKPWTGDLAAVSIAFEADGAHVRARTEDERTAVRHAARPA